MCHFLSALIHPSGELVCRPDLTDSHEDLIEMIQIRDDGSGAFVRLEYLPPDDPSTTWDLDTWLFKVDQEDTPDWFDPDLAKQKCREKIQRMIITENRDLLLGGCYIVAGDARIKKVKNARIAILAGSATVDQMEGAARIDMMLDSSSVGQMEDTASVAKMRDSASVGRMGGSSSVTRMFDATRVDLLQSYASVDRMYSTARVDTVCRYAKVGVMRDSASVGLMTGAASIGQMENDASVERMLGSARVIQMRDRTKAPREPQKDYRGK